MSGEPRSAADNRDIFVEWIKGRAATLWEAAERAEGAFATPYMKAGAGEVARAYREAAALLERRADELRDKLASASHDTGVFEIQPDKGSDGCPK